MDDRAAGIRHDFELEPRASRYSHFGSEPQSSPWFVRLDAPEVERVADGGRVWIAPPSTHPDAAQQQVDRASDSPQPGHVVPPAIAPNLRDGHEGMVRVDVDMHL